MTPGSKFGSYEIVALLRAGGMGQAYRARDTKLGREVAIKVLPEEFTNDKERLARFEREARLLAALNHPNVATLYGLEEHRGKQLLAMELVEGRTLKERAARAEKVARLPCEAVSIATFTPLPLHPTIEPAWGVLQKLKSGG